MRRVCNITAFAICLITTLTALPGTVWAQVPPGQDKNREYTAEQIRSIAPESFLELMEKPDPGYERFAALRALGTKARESDPNARLNILNMVTRVMYDKSRSEFIRFQCCYVISASKDERGLPCLIYVLQKDRSETMRSVAAEAISQYPNFSSNTVIMDALRLAARTDQSAKVLEVVNRSLNTGKVAYTADQVAKIPAQDFLKFMNQPEPGYDKFAAMNALTQKLKQSDQSERESIMKMVIAQMNDKSLAQIPRWQCCYVISGSGDVTGIDALIKVMMNDDQPILRSVAAEALGQFPNSPTIHDALVKARSKENNETVLQSLNKVLSKTGS